MPMSRDTTSMGPLAECHLQQGENLLREHVKGDHTHQKDAPGTGEHVGTRFNPLEARFMRYANL